MTTTGIRSVPVQRAAIARAHMVTTIGSDQRKSYGQAYVVKNDPALRLDTAIAIDQALAQVKAGLSFSRVGWSNCDRRTNDTTTIAVWFDNVDDYEVFDYLIHQNTEVLGEVDVYRSPDVLYKYGVDTVGDA